jgi:hypothetical protein
MKRTCSHRSRSATSARYQSIFVSRLWNERGSSNRVIRERDESGSGRSVNALTFHSLRHTFNSILANAGIAEETRMGANRSHNAKNESAVHASRTRSIPSSNRDAATSRRKLMSKCQTAKLSLAKTRQARRDSVQASIRRSTFLALLFTRHDNIGYLPRRRLARQRKHLVHSDPGSDRCITQAGLANLFLHATGAQFRNVGEDRDDSLFSCAYLRGFATLHCSGRFTCNVAELTNLACRGAFA